MKILNIISGIFSIFFIIFIGFIITYINYILLKEGFYYALIFNILVYLIISVDEGGND